MLLFKKVRFILALCIAVTVFTLPVWAASTKENTTTNTAQKFGGTGIVEARSSGSTAMWIIDGTPYAVTAVTKFTNRQAMTIGSCVAFSTDDTQTLTAVSPTTGCQNGPTRIMFGVIDEMPTRSPIGQWTIDGLTVQSTAATQFSQYDGDFATGVCAEAAYKRTPTGNVAVELATAEPSHCQFGIYTNEITSHVIDMPVGLYGFWHLEGHYFAAGTMAQFDGDFAPGACVQVTYFVGNGRNIIHNIEQRDESACTGHTPQIRGKVYGRLVDGGFPTGQAGEWLLNNDTFVSNQHTRFESEFGSFATGACVHAEYVLVNNVKTITEIETRHDARCSAINKPEFSGFGTIEAMPNTSDRSGIWQINGTTFVVDGRTLIEENEGKLTNGSYVELYYVIAGHQRRLTKIETHKPAGSSN